MNTLDLLNEISTSKLAKRTDAQLQGVERMSKGKIKWTEEKFLIAYEQIKNLDKNYAELGMNSKQFGKLCLSFNKPILKKKRGELKSKMAVKNEANTDIINGMGRDQWCEKYNLSQECFYNRVRRLRQKGLVD